MSEVAKIHKPKLVQAVAERYGVDADKMLNTLKATAFRGTNDISNEQMMSLLIVANQYELNPFTKEIYAFPDKGSIIPVVSVDGWSRIMNSDPQMDGIEFEYSPETVEHNGKTCYVWIDCIIYRKDRSRPIRVREFFDEVVRKTTSGPWNTHPNRMHRHKAEIQCARIAFGFAGIYDADEAERIVESSSVIEINSPELPRVNDEQKGFYDQLIEKSDALGMYVFQNSIPETVRNDLYHSFEKGTKGRYQKIVDGLYGDGRGQFEDYLTLFGDAMAAGDLFLISENAEELSAEVMAMITDMLGDEFVELLEEIEAQA
jgi:phage recombination protein Bet